LFISAHSTHPNWHQAVGECISQVSGHVKGKTLGFVYASDSFACFLQLIAAELQQTIGVESWVGTVGLGICAGFKEVYEQPALSILLTDIDPQHYRTFEGIIGPELTDIPQCGDNTATVGILHGDPCNQSLAKLIKRLADSVPEGFMIGGLSSSRNGNLQIVNASLSEGGISGVLFSDQVPITTAVTQGCSPIAARRTITECSRNVIVLLDDRPALEVMKEDTGEMLSCDTADIGNHIFVGFPVTGSDTGDYLVRQLMGIDFNNNLIAVSEMVEQGQSMMFCRRDGDTARRDMYRMLGSIKKHIGDRQAQGALYYSCLGRGCSLFGPDSQELGMIRQQLGDIPISGFFCNGEIAHNQLHGFTGVLTIFL